MMDPACAAPEEGVESGEQREESGEQPEERLERPRKSERFSVKPKRQTDQTTQ